MEANIIERSATTWGQFDKANSSCSEVLTGRFFFFAGCLYSQQSPNKQQERTHNSELGPSLYWVQQRSAGANSSDLISNRMVAVKGEWNASPLAWYLNSLLFGLSNAIAKAKTWVYSWRRLWYQCRVGHEWLCPKCPSKLFRTARLDWTWSNCIPFLFFSCSFLNDVYPPYNCLHGKRVACSYSEIRTRKEKINKIYACLFPQNHISILLKTDARPQVMAYDSELLMKLFFFWQIEKNSFLILGDNYS